MGNEAQESPANLGSQVWKQFTRGNVAWDRLLALNDAVEIVQAAKPDARGLDDVVSKRDELDQTLTALRQVSDPEKFAGSISGFEAELDLAEARLMRVDSQVPIPLLRRVFQVRDFPEHSIARYVSVLVRHIDEDPERRDRVDFLATRLFSEKLENGRLRMRPYAEVHNILRALIPDTDVAVAHGEAVAFFRDAIRRLQDLKTLQQLFDSGFYVDVRGYKISLREEFLDPDVLYAAAELNTAIHNRMQDYADAEGVDSGAIRERVRAAEREVKGIFEGVDEVEVERHARFDQQRLRAVEEVKKAPRKKKPIAKRDTVVGTTSVSAGRVVALIALMVVVVAGGGFWITKLVIPSNTLVETDPVELGEIHPLLEKGTFSQGKDSQVFIGHLTSSKWLVMPKAERIEVAETIADTLYESGVEDAIVYRDNVLAIQIDSATVVMVE